jgi:hypothetical protein
MDAQMLTWWGIVASLSAFMADFARFAACLDDEGRDRDTPGRNYAVPWGIGKIRLDLGRHLLDGLYEDLRVERLAQIGLRTG